MSENADYYKEQMAQEGEEFDPEKPDHWLSAIFAAETAAGEEVDKGMYGDQKQYEAALIAVGTLAKQAIETHRALIKGESPPHRSAERRDSVQPTPEEVGG